MVTVGLGMVARSGLKLAAAFLIFGLLASGVVVVPAGDAHATMTKAVIFSPINGTVTSPPGSHHRPYGGDWAMDIGGTGDVYARFGNAGGPVTFKVAQIAAACSSSNGGQRVRVDVHVSGQWIGWVVYSHLTNISVGLNTWHGAGTRIGRVATGLPVSSSCWTGPHVHLESYNNSKYSCYVPRGYGAGVSGSSALGVVGGEYATGVNQACPSGATNPPAAPVNNPFGHFDSASSPEPGKVRVRGWAIDRDAFTSPIAVHVYIGGTAGAAGAQGYAITANVSRPDVGAAYPGAGNNHGFDATLPTPKVGAQQVCAYAINTGSGSNQSLGCKTVTITDAPPVVKMVAPAKRLQRETAFPVKWNGSDAQGIAGFDVQHKVLRWNGEIRNWSTWLDGTTATSATYGGPFGRTYCFRARAEDNRGNVSSYTAMKCTAVPLASYNLQASSSWKRYSVPTAYAGSVYRSSANGATLKRTGLVAERLYLLATTCPTCGTIEVRWNGRAFKTIDLSSPTTVRGVQFGLAAWSSAKQGTLSIVVKGSGKPVVIEGLGVYRD